MKKLLIATLALITALSISLAACDKGKDKEPLDEEPDDDLIARPSDDTTTTGGGETTTGNGGSSSSWTVKNDTIYVLTDCNIRASATTTSAKLGTATAGQTFQRTEANSKWSKITFNNGEAYILNALITDSQARATFDTKTGEDRILLHLKADKQSNLRSFPSAEDGAENVVAQITTAHTANSDNELRLEALSQDGVWAKVSYKGNLGTENAPIAFDGTEVLYINVGVLVEFSNGGGSQLPG